MRTNIHYIPLPKGKRFRAGELSAELTWYPQYSQRWSGRFNRGQGVLDSAVLQYSDAYVPMRSGSLKQRAVVATAVGSGLIVYPGPYAKVNWYGKAMAGKAPKHVTTKDIVFHRGAPKRGKMWVKRMWADRGKAVTTLVRKTVGGRK